MDAYIVLIQLLNGVQQGLLLFLVASGLTMIFGIMGIINLAHGSFYMIGAYLAWAGAAATGSLLLGILLGLVASVAIGILLEWTLIRRLYQRDHLYQVLLTFGLIMIFEELRSVLVGDEVHSVPVPALFDHSLPLTETLSYPVYNLVISGACLVVAALIYHLIQNTRLGMMIRAGAANREMVQALGIDIKKIYTIVFAFGLSLAAFAGMIAAPVSTVYPGMGGQILIISFVVVVIGGIGSIKGTLAAALLIGVVDTFGKIVLPEIAGMTVYLLMAAVLLWRPRGLFAGGR